MTLATALEDRFALRVAVVVAAGLLVVVGAARAEEARPAPSPERGYAALTESAWVGASFDQETFDALWQGWPEPLRARAAAATPAERRRMAFARYGLTERPGDDSGKPLQYVVDAEGRWSMSCLLCHAGAVAGRVVPGAPNANLALQTLSEDVRAAKLRLKKRWTSGDFALAAFPMGGNVGTTNAVMFSVSLLAMRDRDLNVVPPREPVRFAHHDLDAPPWWNVRKRTHLYVDGFAPKSHRALMQFALVPQNGPERLRAFEDAFRDVLAYVESLEAPRWPHAVDAGLAARGRVAFDRHCAECHGTHGAKPSYPNRRVPLAVVGTDPVRLESIAPAQRAAYAESWFTDHRPDGVVTHPDGYVAPPLDGAWASAPYFHNGSVPTLWHVLHPDARPRVWRRTPGDADGYDEERVGLAVECLDAVPPEALADKQERRHWFDVSGHGKSAAGHRFPDRLTEAERRAVLEYLKTL
jgi:mono/diheme cytochrome c family protein